jgi:diaminopimelate decarboxylase
VTATRRDRPDHAVASPLPQPSRASALAQRDGPIPRHLLPDSAATGPFGQLVIGGVDIVELSSEVGTPLFVYDEAQLRSRCREAFAVFGEGVAYAAKAFLCLEMARLAHAEGLHLDVATGGELHVALAAGVPADRLVLHGNNKSLDELDRALAAGVGRIVVDNADEMDRIEVLVGRGRRRPQVLLRVTPGVEAHTHEYVSTGQDDSKFGFGVRSGAAAAAVARAMASPAMELMGIHCHIGSQVYRVDSFAMALEVVAGFAEPYGLPELSLGGGLGVAYVEGEWAPTITEWGKAIVEGAAALGVRGRVTAEPGRSLVASAAVTVYTVGSIKHIPGVRTYVAVDGGFGDNPRPVLYGSDYTTFAPAALDAARPGRGRVVGKHCESGDILVRDAPLPADLAVGDLLATPVTGAYGLTMGSNYNKVLRPPAVFVADGSARLVVRRETDDDLLLRDL